MITHSGRQRSRTRRVWCPSILLGLGLAIAMPTLAGEPAPAEVHQALKQLAPATLTIDRAEFVNGSDKKFLIAGRADRNATISAYLRALETSGRFHKTELLQVALNSEGRPMFEITVERQPEIERNAKAEPAAAPAPKKPTVYRCTIDGREVFQSVPCPAAAQR